MDLAKIRKKARVSKKDVTAEKPEEPLDIGPVASPFEEDTAAEAAEEESPAPRKPKRKAAARKEELQDPQSAAPEDEYSTLTEEFSGVSRRRDEEPAQEGEPEPAPPEIGLLRQETEVEDEKMIICLVGRERYAIPIMDVSMIIDNKPPTRIPRVPEFLVGIISLRGKIVTVLDARSRLGISGSPALEEAKIIVIEKGNDSFGIRVEGIDHVVEVNRNNFEEPPEGVSRFAQDFVDGVFYYRKRAVASLNLDLFLTFEV